MKLNINGKMLTYVLSASLLIYIAAVGYISYKLRDISSNNAIEVIESQFLSQADGISEQVSLFLGTAKLTTETLVEAKKINISDNRTLIRSIAKQILIGNEGVVEVWGYFDAGEAPVVFDTLLMEDGFAMSEEPFSLRCFRKESEIISEESQVILDSLSYQNCKEKLHFHISQPYRKSDSSLHSKIAFPIVVDYEFIGVLAIEFKIDRVSSIMGDIGAINYYASIVSADGKIWVSNDENLIGEATNIYGEANSNKILADSIGHTDVFWAKNKLSGDKSLFLIRPLDVEGLSLKYIVALPNDFVNASSRKTVMLTVLVGVIGLVAMSLFIYFASKLITVPLVRTTRKLQKIAQGDLNVLDNNKKTLLEDEMSDIVYSMTDLVSSLESASVFANEIGRGNLDAKYKLVSREDVLGQSLLTMQQRLKNAKIEEDEKNIENEKRNWVTDGLAKFGEIIRENNDNMEKFCQNVLKNLLSYLNAAQGAMYVQAQKDLSDGDSRKQFVLMSAQAYGKTIMMSGEVFREQEITGRVLDENRIIVMDMLPDNFATLSPGMKDQKRPNNLIVVPMSINDDIYGVIEMLSYNKFESHHIDFIDKVSENIASVISSVNVNINTAKLLEQSQIQADELSQHEEEMRQNLEEMQATQEESQKRESKLLNYLAALNHNLISAQIDLKGRVLEISPIMSAKYNVNIETAVGKYYDALVTADDKSKAVFTQFWNKLLKTGYATREQVVENRGNNYYFNETYIRVQQDNSSAKILMVAEEKTKETELNEMLVAEVKSLEAK